MFAISICVSIVLGNGEIDHFLIVGTLHIIRGLTRSSDRRLQCLYVCGAVVSLWVILHQVPGGWAHVSAVAEAAGKFQVCDTHFNLTREFFSQPYNIWAGLIGGCFAATASHGTEQLMVQRLLAARSEKASRMALLAVGCNPDTIHSVPGNWCDLIRPLSGLGSARASASGPPVSGICLEQSASNRVRPGDCRYPGRRHVKPQCSPQFTGFDHRDGLLPSSSR